MLQHHTEDGTALHPAAFKLKYEFVDTRLGGDEWYSQDDPGPCHRVFRKSHVGEVVSPRNVFLYGRGGAGDIHCVYRFEADSDERVRLILNNASFGGSSGCTTVNDPHSGRPSCQYQTGARVAELGVWELPWRDTRVPRACLCDNATLAAKPMVFLSSSGTLELHFTAREMGITEDFGSLNFHATFELVKMPACPRQQRLRGDGSYVHFSSPPIDRAELLCSGMPWLVEARHNKSLFLLSWGAALPLKVCTRIGLRAGFQGCSRRFVSRSRPVARPLTGC